MPLLWDLDGNGVGEAEVEERNLHGIAAHGTHHLSGDPLAGIENLLASGAIYALGDLYHLSGDTIFRDAAKRIVEPLVESVLDPYHDPAAEPRSVTTAGHLKILLLINPFALN